MTPPADHTKFCPGSRLSHGTFWIIIMLVFMMLTAVASAVAARARREIPRWGLPHAPNPTPRKGASAQRIAIARMNIVHLAVYLLVGFVLGLALPSFAAWLFG